MKTDFGRLLCFRLGVLRYKLLNQTEFQPSPPLVQSRERDVVCLPRLDERKRRLKFRLIIEYFVSFFLVMTPSTTPPKSFIYSTCACSSFKFAGQQERIKIKVIILKRSSSTVVFCTRQLKSTRFKLLNLCTFITTTCSLHCFSFCFFFTNNQTHGYSTRTANNYRIHHCRTNLKKFTILYQGPKIWNSLPVQITSLSSFPNFKKKLLEFLVK